MPTLVIVESPAKARTLSRILGKGYRVEASMGHIRDLPQSASEIPSNVKGQPWARLGVDVQHGFEPVYVIPAERKAQIKKLRQAVKEADEVLLATDEDREGESISWHVTEVLKPKVPVRRIVFHEITDEAIHKALEAPRDIDDALVRAQESRRILDRLFGYELSPLLWKKVRPKLSAGRVQSVAVRLLVMRERQRRAFRSAVWYDAEADFEKDGRRFTAKLVRLGEQALVSGNDFDPNTGELKEKSKALWLREEADLSASITSWTPPWNVTSVAVKPYKRRPAPPFTTSTLQQEANRKLRFSAEHTMRVAQRLYEGIEINGDRVGVITYMRTDSLHLAERALRQAQAVIRELYGDDYTTGPRHFKTKSKLAQEAHEAIRPTDLSRRPEDLERYLNRDELRLYELIWKRTVASQMAEARLHRTTVEILAQVDPNAGENLLTPTDLSTAQPGLFQVSGTTIDFPGFLRAYVEGSDDPEAELSDREILLPDLHEGDAVTPQSIETKSHETSPPARFTEASLVKTLEEEGIGRPSTYASILSKIQRRGYAFHKGNALVPTFTAYAVTKLLEAHFRDYVDTEFTAKMEEQLDRIASGELDWQQHLEHFYFGGDGDVPEPGLEGRIATEEPKMEFPAIELGRHPRTGIPIMIRIGRYGAYLQYQPENGPVINASLPEDLPPADLTLEDAITLLRRSDAADEPLGEDPETGEPVYLLTGRFGPYVQLGETPERGSKAPKPKRASLPKDVSPESVTLEQALKWLSLPRVLGKHPDSDDEVLAKSGPYGPYVECGAERRSLESADDVYAIGLDRALELLAQPKKRGRSRTSNRQVLKEFGKTESGGTLQLLDGRYGPYLSDGEKNASLRKGESADALTEEEAQRIFAERAKVPKRRRRK
jgi:DNA topoisomerase-1